MKRKAKTTATTGTMALDPIPHGVITPPHRENPR